LGNLTKTPDTSPAILKAMEQAKSQYFADFRNLSDEVRRTKEGGAPYPMNGSKWIATTTPQIGSLLDVMYAANDASEAYMSELKMTAYERLITVSVILCSILIFGLLCIYYVIGRVTAPLSALSVAIGRLADGQLNTSIPGAHRRDELGDVARTVKVFKDGLMEVERLRQQNEQEQKLKDQQGLERERERAQRDLEQRQKVARAEEINKIIQQFEAEMRDTIAELTKSAASLDKTATDLAGATNQSTQKAQSVAEDSTSASSNVQLVASATHQLSASIREISDQVGGSTRIVGEAVREAEVADTAVQGLSEAASRIGSILELISSIASKTDLLALNATIEAARAGDAGKGFAVVASEVKNLATQTARATEDISRQISDMQSATTSSVTAIKHITKIITEIDQISSSISSAVEEQAAATSDIARNVEQASVGTANVSRNIAGVQNAAVVTADIVSHVRSASKGLFDGTTKVDQMVKNFLNEVRQS
jgi:methyl-accepting chemotaxis protein